MGKPKKKRASTLEKPEETKSDVLFLLKDNYSLGYTFTRLSYNSIVSVNPLKKQNVYATMDDYIIHQTAVDPLPPHLFDIAFNAFSHMKTLFQNQCLFFL